MNYLDTYDAYVKYAHLCEEKVREKHYSATDAKGIINFKNEDINSLVINHRLKMINTKIDHTMRMINDIIKVNEKLGFKINLQEVLKVATLYHDIGRLRQSTWSNTFSDKSYQESNSPFMNHGEDGYNIFINNDFKVGSKYIPVIGMSILHHLDHHRLSELTYKFDCKLDSIDIDSILTGNFILNEGEWRVASLIVQLVADIDKIDILYQHLTTFSIIQEYIEDRSKKSLDEISVFWGIPKKDIIEYNDIDINNYKPQVVKIPVKNLDIAKLRVPEFYIDCFYNNNWPSLKELREREDWNFITAMWWKLGVFLNQVEFYVNLENIDESNLIPKLYASVPGEYQELLKEAFFYSDEVLVKKRLKDNIGKIYL